VGIGGIGMSGIAEIMLRVGYVVQGSDARASANTERLEALGAKVFLGHDGAQVDGASAVVFSTAIRPDNPEIVAARERRLPLVRRAEMLGELMRLHHSVAVSGTHGKTTTTSLVAALLDAGGLDPTVVNGGIVNAYGANAKVGDGEWMVVEADESDGTFIRPSRSSPTSTPSTSITMASSTQSGGRSRTSSKTSPSMASPFCARTIRRCRRWPRGSRIGGW
jgi:UDP-N-acetylmuramate--alanine ligase